MIQFVGDNKLFEILTFDGESTKYLAKFCIGIPNPLTTCRTCTRTLVYPISSIYTGHNNSTYSKLPKNYTVEQYLCIKKIMNMMPYDVLYGKFIPGTKAKDYIDYDGMDLLLKIGGHDFKIYRHCCWVTVLQMKDDIVIKNIGDLLSLIDSNKHNT